MKKIPYKETTKINKHPKKNFVLNIANLSRPFEIFFAKICVNIKTPAKKLSHISTWKIPKVVIITKNQKLAPNVTASALNLGDESCN